MHGLAIDAKGNLWVAAGSRVQEFNPKANSCASSAAAGSGNGQFEALTGVAIDPEGHLWTLEAGMETFYKAKLQEFSLRRRLPRQVRIRRRQEAGQLKNPQALAIDASGNFWVADTGNHRIAEFNAKGEFQRASGSEGTENGQFKNPRGIATDTAGNVWVADTGNNRIQELSPAGAYLAQFGKSGDNNGQFSEPKGLTVDAKGNIWVADTGNNRVEEWSPANYPTTYNYDQAGKPYRRRTGQRGQYRSDQRNLRLRRLRPAGLPDRLRDEKLLDLGPHRRPAAAPQRRLDELHLWPGRPADRARHPHPKRRPITTTTS